MAKLVEIITETMSFLINRITFSTHIALMKEKHSLHIELEKKYAGYIPRVYFILRCKLLAEENIIVICGFGSKRHLSSHLSIKDHAYILCCLIFIF